MRETINNLAKGIINTPIPEIKLIPDVARARLPVNAEAGFGVEVRSSNGQSIKGVCFCDDKRVKFSGFTFAGRNIPLTLKINTFGLQDGDFIKGNIVLITNAGEILYPYEFEIFSQKSDADFSDLSSGTADIFLDNPLTYDLRESHDKIPLCNEKFPIDEDSFAEMIRDMIRSKDESAFAFKAYKEAIKRKLNITHLFESYLDAYPDLSDEKMPREVLLYFSYESNLSLEEKEKLFSNIIRFEDTKSELFESYSHRISVFGMTSALSGRMNERLFFIYDRILLSDMVDLKAAQILPDILSCRLIKTEETKAKFLTVSYSWLNIKVIAKIVDGRCFVPVYFNDVIYNFYSGDVNKADLRSFKERELIDVKFTEDKLFDKPEILAKCFKICPEHEMFLAMNCLKIAENGIKHGFEQKQVTEALKTNLFNKSFRNKLIFALCNTKSDTSWTSLLVPSDYNCDTKGMIFKSFINDSRYLDAYKLIMNQGYDIASLKDLSLMTEGLILDPVSDQIREDITKCCKFLFDKEEAKDLILKYLCKNYSGSIEDMLRIESFALRNNIALFSLPEKILTFELFTGNHKDIDRAFKVYVNQGDYDEMVVRAYLYVRSEEYFLKNEKVDEGILMDALEGYLRKKDDPEKVPYLLSMALTSYYADKSELTDMEIGLCQKLTDMLISKGYVFGYTKKLAKKIQIPEEISWKYYIEYKSISGGKPRLMIRILPDDETYHESDIRRVYKNIYLMSTVLFMGDQLSYLIYEGENNQKPATFGTIKVSKLHETGDGRMKYINKLADAIENRDIETLRDDMLEYTEHVFLSEKLFGLGE